MFFENGLVSSTCDVSLIIRYKTVLYKSVSQLYYQLYHQLHLYCTICREQWWVDLVVKSLGASMKAIVRYTVLYLTKPTRPTQPGRPSLVGKICTSDGYSYDRDEMRSSA